MSARFLVRVVAVVVWLILPVIGYGGDQPRSDQEQIQGSWVCVAALKDGKEVDQFVGVRAVMRGNQLTWTFPLRDGTTRTETATFTLDTTPNPKHFDWSSDAKPAEMHRRLYVLRGDVLLWSTNIG